MSEQRTEVLVVASVYGSDETSKTARDLAARCDISDAGSRQKICWDAAGRRRGYSADGRDVLRNVESLETIQSRFWQS